MVVPLDHIRLRSGVVKRLLLTVFVLGFFSQVAEASCGSYLHKLDQTPHSGEKETTLCLGPLCQGHLPLESPPPMGPSPGELAILNSLGSLVGQSSKDWRCLGMPASPCLGFPSEITHPPR